MKLDDYVKYYISSDDFMKPSYKISPFMTSDLSFNHELLSQDVNYIDSIFLEKFESKYDVNFSSSGRESLKVVLETMALCEFDVVTILTTTDTLYVSSCVTKTIEKYCQWNRVITSESRLILVIHEFGKQYSDVKGLIKYNLPIIEDYAHSFPALFKCNDFFGDFVLFSLSKFLPLQKGGLLLSKKKYGVHIESSYLTRIAEKTFTHYSTEFESFFEQRKLLETIYIKKLSSIGAEPFFQYQSFECPGAFVFQCALDLELLQGMKEFLQKNAIECSVFYGNKAFFLPCHHRMTQFDVEYIVYLIRLFLENNIENK